jgi:hypothetical protein
LIYKKLGRLSASGEFLEKMGKKGLEEFRDFCLDRIIYVDKQIEKLSKD